MAEKKICGDVWTWVAIDADSKLICSWLVGKRDGGFATDFIQGLANRLANRVQLMIDGHKVYLNAVIDEPRRGASNAAVQLDALPSARPPAGRAAVVSAFISACHFSSCRSLKLPIRVAGWQLENFISL
jgi:hypothetical protein